MDLIGRMIDLLRPRPDRRPGPADAEPVPARCEKPAPSARPRAFQGWLRIRESLSLPLRAALGAVPVALLLLLWTLLTDGAAEARVISPLILPSPLEVVTAFRSLWFDAELSRSVVASTGRVVVGFLIGLAVAFPLSMLMGSFTKVKALFEPSAVFLSYLPIPALVPLTMSIFGIGETQKAMFLALAFLIYLLPLFVKAVEEVDNVYLQTAYTMGADRRRVVAKVLLPMALPQIVHAMRLGFGVGWTYIILAEMVAAERGLGQIIIIAQRRGPREHIYLVLVVIVLIAYLTDKLWARLHRALFPYLGTR
ncbi:MAG: ABC transporter permease [Candidatus Edwardsbacteria bacterium]|jgi:NitT/TauT family transport system permease protein|nr:ABC transporter permease [Candidatus Edwardsbacteria bacterium]